MELVRQSVHHKETLGAFCGTEPVIYPIWVLDPSFCGISTSASISDPNRIWDSFNHSSQDTSQTVGTGNDPVVQLF